MTITIQGRSQDLARGGGKNNFFRIGNFHAAKRHMLLCEGCSRTCSPEKIEMVEFGAL